MLYTAVIMTLLIFINVVMFSIPRLHRAVQLQAQSQLLYGMCMCLNACAWVQINMQTEHPCSRAVADVPLQQPAQHAHRPRRRDAAVHSGHDDRLLCSVAGLHCKSGTKGTTAGLPDAAAALEM